MHCFSNKAPRPQLPLTFNIGDLKLRDLAKLLVLKTDYEEIEFKKTVMTLSSLRHRKTSQSFPFWSSQSKFLATPLFNYYARGVVWFFNTGTVSYLTIAPPQGGDTKMQ